MCSEFRNVEWRILKFQSCEKGRSGRKKDLANSVRRLINTQSIYIFHIEHICTKYTELAKKVTHGVRIKACHTDISDLANKHELDF